MDIIWTEKKPNYSGTIAALPVDDQVIFPYRGLEMDAQGIRVICSRMKEKKFQVNKTINGVRVTRIA